MFEFEGVEYPNDEHIAYLNTINPTELFSFEIDGDSICVNGVGIYITPVEVERKIKTLNGTYTKTVIEWEVSAEKIYYGGYWEPDDIDYEVISVEKNLADALAKVYCVYYTDVIKGNAEAESAAAAIADINKEED